MKTKDLHLEVVINSIPEEIYDALMDSERHSYFTKSECEISQEVGGFFSAYDGYITGQNLELIPNKKIVQLWRADEPNWPKDLYSKVTFEIMPPVEGTVIKFSHEGIPLEYVESIKEGWTTYYWAPLADYLMD